MKIEEITNSNITSDKKILKIKMILNLYNVEDVIIEYEDI